MKTRYINQTIAVIASLIMCSCVNENFESQGAADDCIGVYFVEEQENATSHVLERGVDKTSLDFEVRRIDDQTQEKVEFSAEVYYIEEESLTDTSTIEKVKYVEDLFIFGTLEFKEGQKVTSLNVRFDRAKSGVVYYCNLSITDPKYVSPYSYNASSISFSVQVCEWAVLPKKIRYRDALLSDVFATWEGRYAETEVLISQRKDKPGYYRLHDVYSAEYIARLKDGEEAYNADPEKLKEEYSDYVLEKHYIYMDATDPEKVFFPAQRTGFIDPSYGHLILASDVEEVFGSMSNHLYGSNVDNVITFPKNALNLGIGAYYYFSNLSGKTRIVLSGGDARDFGLDIETEEVTSEGKIPVTFKPAKDVSYIKYAIFEGKVSDAEIEEKATNVQTAEEGSYIRLEAADAENIQDITFKETDKSGIFTLVACTYDSSDNFKEYAYAYLGYLKGGEDKDKEPMVYIGAYADDRYHSDKEDENYDATNSFQYWIRGKNLTHAQIAFYPTEQYNAYKETIQKDFINAGSLDSQYIQVLNESELSGVIGNTLKAGTSYTLIVYAGNEYRSDFYEQTVTTAGEQDPVQRIYYYTDLKEQMQDTDKFTTDRWIPVSVDIFDEEAEGRTIRGKKSEDGEFKPYAVTFRKEDGKMVASGLFPALASNPDITFDIKDNKLVSTENTLEKVYVRDTTHLIPGMHWKYLYRPKMGSYSSEGYFYEIYKDKDKNEHYDFITAGFVHEDIIAFTDNNTEEMFWTLCLGGYQTYAGEDIFTKTIGDAHGYLILVRESATELLEGLLEKESEEIEEEKDPDLSRHIEQHMVYGSSVNSIEADLKKCDIAHDLVEFSVTNRTK